MAKSVKDAYAAVLGGSREEKKKAKAATALPVALPAVDVVDVVERHVQAITAQVRQEYGTTSWIERAPAQCVVCQGQPDEPHLHGAKLWQGGKLVF